MSDATQTKLVGVTLPEKWYELIQNQVAKNPLTNVQDYIRYAIMRQMKIDHLLEES